MKAPALNAREQNNETLKASSSVGHENTFHVAVLRACVLGAVHRINSVAFCVFRLWAVWLVSKSSLKKRNKTIQNAAREKQP